MPVGLLHARYCATGRIGFSVVSPDRLYGVRYQLPCLVMHNTFGELHQQYSLFMVYAVAYFGKA